MDKSGALKDMVQNHLLQVLPAAMEEPVISCSQGIHDSQLGFFLRLKPYRQC